MNHSVAAITIISIILILTVLDMIYIFPSKNFALKGAATLVTTHDHLFIIIMATYTRKDGKSPYYVKKAVKSILGQSYSNWQLFVTGDKYENETEFRSLFTSIPSSKLFLYNLPEPGERGNLTGVQLWESGGVKAMNNAMKRAEQHHNRCDSSCTIYFTNLDDDDIWSTEHLREMLSIYIRFPSVVYAWTKGYYCPNGGNPFPPHGAPQEFVDNWPHAFGGQTLHSSWSWSMKVFRGFRYRGHWDFPPDYKGSMIADLDLFEVVRAHIAEKKLHYYHSNRATIEHLKEQGHTCTKSGPLWYPD